MFKQSARVYSLPAGWLARKGAPQSMMRQKNPARNQLEWSNIDAAKAL
jgi:hypothetical protein